MQREIDAAVAARHAFARQLAHLFAERSAARREGDAAVGTQDTVPGQLETSWRATQDQANQTCASGQSGAHGNFTITDNFAARDCRNDAANSRVIGVEACAGNFDRRGTHGLIGYAGQASPSAAGAGRARAAG